MQWWSMHNQTLMQIQKQELDWRKKTRQRERDVVKWIENGGKKSLDAFLVNQPERSGMRGRWNLRRKWAQEVWEGVMKSNVAEFCKLRPTLNWKSDWGRCNVGEHWGHGRDLRSMMHSLVLSLSEVLNVCLETAGACLVKSGNPYKNA